jgi:hypothetical protein
LRIMKAYHRIQKRVIISGIFTSVWRESLANSGRRNEW